MEYGIVIPNLGPNAQPGVMEQAAKEAESLGFDAVYVNDHIIIPESESYVPAAIYDPYVVMATMIGATERIRIGASVIVIPLRSAALNAKMVATLDHMSGGRIILGTGVGWIESEMAAVNVDFHKRGAICDEYLDAMHVLWTEDSCSFQGKFVSFEGMRQEPKPVQNPFPVWVGGNLPQSIRRAARRGTGWMPLNIGEDKFADLADSYRKECESAGRPVGTVCMRIMEGGPTFGGRLMCVGEPEQIAADLDQLAEQGLTQIQFAPTRVKGLDDIVREMRVIAEKVRPLVRN